MPRSIGQIVEQLEDNLIVTPKYQRKPDLWDISKKSKFIESLIYNCPFLYFILMNCQMEFGPLWTDYKEYVH